jgi:hypothetical protein
MYLYWNAVPAGSATVAFHAEDEPAESVIYNARQKASDLRRGGGTYARRGAPRSKLSEAARDDDMLALHCGDRRRKGDVHRRGGRRCGRNASARRGALPSVVQDLRVCGLRRCRGPVRVALP